MTVLATSEPGALAQRRRRDVPRVSCVESHARARSDRGLEPVVGSRSGVGLIRGNVQDRQFGRDFEIILFGRRRLALL